MTSTFDQYRPPEPPRRRRFGRVQGEKRRPKRRTDGSAEMLMVPEPEFSSYYGQNIVEAAAVGARGGGVPVPRRPRAAAPASSRSARN